MRSATAALLCLLAAAGLAFGVGCGSPLNGDDDPTATATDEALSMSVMETPSPAGESDAGETATPLSSPTEPVEPGGTATIDPPATPASVATSSPTLEPLPDGGGELLIEGMPITRIIPGSDTGRTMYAISDDLLWRTNDGGRTWSEAGDGDIGTVVVALNEPNVLYSGDRGDCGRGFSFYDFVRSTDAGRTWETVDDNRDIGPLLAFEGRQGAYVYGSNCGLSVSADGGDTWRLVPDLNGEQVFAVATERGDPLSQLLVVGVTEGGTGRLFLLDSDDPAFPQFIGAVAQFWANAALDWNDGRLVLATVNAVGVSDDGGEDWSWSRNGIEEATFSVDPLFEGIPNEELDPFRGFDFARIDPTDRDRLWVAGVHGAYLSRDGGRTWELVGDDAHVTGLVISTVGDRVLISTEDGTRLWTLSGE